MNVRVAYAGPEGEAIVEVCLAGGASVTEAVAASGIVDRLGLVETALCYAIHGQRAQAATPLREGDRIELLRPLVADPKETRRRRAARPRTGG